MNRLRVSGASPKKSNAASHSSTTNSAKTTKKVHASASTKKMVTWADVCRKHRLTRGLLELCYTNKSISVNPQLLQLTYANKKKREDKKEGGAVAPKNVIKVTALPEKLKITVSTNTKETKKNKTTQHETQPQVPDDLIAYMEGRFRELERKIEIAVNTCKALQDNACMCSEDEFKIKETVPQTNISIGLNTQKKPKVSVGTNSTDGFAEKEMNTEKKKKRKRGKTSKLSSCDDSQAEVHHCGCSTEDFDAASRTHHCGCSTEDVDTQEHVCRSVLKTPLKLPQGLEEKVIAVEEFGSVSSEFSRSIRVDVKEKGVGGEDKPAEKAASRDSVIEKELEMLPFDIEAEEEATKTKAKRVSIIAVKDLDVSEDERAKSDDATSQRKVSDVVVRSKSPVSIEDGLGEKRASVNKDIEKRDSFVPSDISRDDKQPSSGSKSVEEGVFLKSADVVKTPVVKESTKRPNRFTFSKSKEKLAKKQKPSPSGSVDKNVEAAESLHGDKTPKRFGFEESRDSLGKAQKPSSTGSGGLKEGVSAKSVDTVGVKPSEKFNSPEVDSVESEEDLPPKSSKFHKLVAKKDSLIVLVDHKKKEGPRRESEESELEAPPTMDELRKQRRSISFAAAKAVINAQPQEAPPPKTPDAETTPQYTDQELFDKLLKSYERENDIVERLSKDDEFFEAQLSAVRSKESIKKIIAETKQEETQKKSKFGKFFKHKSSVTEIVPTRDATSVPSEDQLDVVATADKRIADQEMKQIHEDIKAMEAPVKVQFSGSSLTRDEKNFIFPKSGGGSRVLQRSDVRTSSLSEVQPKEIGQCFRRGFRPDNIVLTGEPCLKVSEREQIRRISGDDTVMFIDFSERDTPLEFLLGLGFSVDEASNAIKDEDVKNRLNAAITEVSYPGSYTLIYCLGLGPSLLDMTLNTNSI